MTDPLARGRSDRAGCDSNEAHNAGRGTSPRLLPVCCQGYPDENARCTACGRDEDAHLTGRVATPGTPEDVCANCKGTGWDATSHFDDQPAEPHACSYCQGGTYSGQPATSGATQ